MIVLCGKLYRLGNASDVSHLIIFVQIEDDISGMCIK